jgi:hypothetical protein
MALSNYQDWNVEQYWSEWDRACINGDRPVSVRRFLAALGVPGRLRLLGRPFNEHRIRRLPVSADRFRSGGIVKRLSPPPFSTYEEVPSFKYVVVSRRAEGASNMGLINDERNRITFCQMEGKALGRSNAVRI